jgi:uncharacterized membrane protein YedE/YeeE
MNVIKLERWSPYVVGAGIGILSWITFGLMGKALGTSTTFVRWAGLIESIFDKERVTSNAYYAKYLVDKPAVDWQMMLVIGLFLGALISALLSRSFRVERVPALWKWRCGESRLLRYFGAFVGGFLVLFGARLAGGCTSGHGISGALQFSLSSWVFFASFFTAGIATAFIIFGKEGRRHV